MAENPRYEIDIVSKSLDRRLSVLSTLASFATAIGVFAGIFFGYQQIAQQPEAMAREMVLQRETQQDQWQQKFYDNQIDVYRNASTAAAKIATLKKTGAPSEEIERAYVEFSSYFWGPMCIFEGADVERAMVKFKTGVDSKKSAHVLEQLALKLSHICRNETHHYYFRSPEPASRLGSNAELLAEMERLLSRKPNR